MERHTGRRTAIAAEVRAELARQRKTKKSLAEATGISPYTLTRRLAGEKPFLAEELQDIVVFLELPMQDFLDRVEAHA
ncbi:helix-turn-helix domain-containing protein [Leifsonia sp. Root227]|uniref:helix-turn-helix domain-containing protein n=1 Tax=Leifsonia sp. Root227 TaxID=1736496 RepID=UPI000AC5C6BF|nr:helix-turn-helix domain-containing protein [Leifsonia sp. Root227]